MVVRNDIEAVKGMTEMEKTYWFKKNLKPLMTPEAVRPGDFIHRFPNSLDHAFLPVIRATERKIHSYDSYLDLIFVDCKWQYYDKFYRL